MARIRKVEIRNFRSIASLDWCPGAGLNCLIGPGDSGKSTLLDAIDFALGARRTLSVSDTDFHGMDVGRAISITVTLGDLSESLLNLDGYGDYLRGFDAATSAIEDEPGATLESVLTLQLTIGPDLEPVWRMFSERTRDAEPRPLPWRERVALHPARLGNYGSSHLTWTRNSLLNRLSEERADVGVELLAAARDARNGFGDRAGAQLQQTLAIVTATAKGLGVPVGTAVKALLDAHAVSFTDGAISLHSEQGIPLKSLGTGSVRLLIAGLQRQAADTASVALVDELEYGLEPHRIIRLLDSLGAKDERPPLQVFLTTHSPVVLRELSGDQLYVLRNDGASHSVRQVGTGDDVQGTIRRDPEAFLARTVLVGEGASEVGLVRGLDEFYTGQGHASLQARGVSYVDTGGGDPDRVFRRGLAMLALGYRVATVADNDKPADAALVERFVRAGGFVLQWREGRALEDELFRSLPDQAVTDLIDRALEDTDDGVVANHIATKSEGRFTLDAIRAAAAAGYSPAAREVLGIAARTRKGGWFKSITKMSAIARDIVGPHLDRGEAGFREQLMTLFRWAHDD
jgi:putative ATP-dependent endonuclease of the OLD family